MQLSMQQDKYDELFEMLEEAQDELRGHRSRGNPKATRHCYTSSALQPASGAGADSLASELQNSLQQQEEEKQTRKYVHVFKCPSKYPYAFLVFLVYADNAYSFNTVVPTVIGNEFY